MSHAQSDPVYHCNLGWGTFGEYVSDSRAVAEFHAINGGDVEVNVADLKPYGDPDIPDGHTLEQLGDVDGYQFPDSGRWWRPELFRHRAYRDAAAQGQARRCAEQAAGVDSTVWRVTR